MFVSPTFARHRWFTTDFRVASRSMIQIALAICLALAMNACGGAQKSDSETTTAKAECADCQKAEGECESCKNKHAAHAAHAEKHAQKHAEGGCEGCKKAGGECADCKNKHVHGAALQMMTGEQLAERMKAGTAGTIYDVNGKDRYLAGHVVGAVHASHLALVAGDLPADKAAQIVFYCGSDTCKASHKAAMKATDYGHTNVWVMSDGIAGWEAKKLPTEKGGTPMAFGVMDAAALQQKMQGAAQIHVFDVNSDERYAAGHIAGAAQVKLDAFDATKLPPNKAAMVVFYCGSPKCGASHKAAKLAVAKGYSDVWVMYEGIKGWEDQSLPTSK
jgi:rhodanese-related sulfurtransferase